MKNVQNILKRTKRNQNRLKSKFPLIINYGIKGGKCKQKNGTNLYKKKNKSEIIIKNVYTGYDNSNNNNRLGK